MKFFLPICLPFFFLTIACKKKEDAITTQTPSSAELFEISYRVAISGNGKWEHAEFEYVNENGNAVKTTDTSFFTFNKSFIAKKGFSSRLYVKGALTGNGEVTVLHQIRNSQKNLVYDYYKSYAIEKGKLEYTYETHYQNK